MCVGKKSQWDRLKVSCDASNTSYRIGGVGERFEGEPEVPWKYIVFIQDVRMIWCMGVTYVSSDEMKDKYYTKDEVSQVIAEMIAEHDKTAQHVDNVTVKDEDKDLMKVTKNGGTTEIDVNTSEDDDILGILSLHE